MQERRRFEQELVHLSEGEVFKPDTRGRVPIGDTLAVPHRWICRLTTPNSDPTEHGYGLGTGVLVGPRHVLTAAHVLVSEVDPGKTVGDRLRVEPAINGFEKPFDPVGVLGWQVNPDWIFKSGNTWHVRPENDYALVTLKKNVSQWRNRGLGGCTLGFWGDTGPCGAGSEVGFDASNVVGQEARVTGYPGDKPTGTLWTSRGAITFEPRLGRLRHTADTKGGESGAPIWLVQNGVACLVGVHSGANGAFSVDANGKTVLTHNGAALLTAAVVRRIASWRATYAP